MIPKDPFMLLSYLNTQLRDYYPSLEALAEGLELDMEELIQRWNRLIISTISH